VSDTTNTGAGEPVAAVEPAGKARFLIPLGIFVVLAGFLFVGLGLNPREVPSPFIGKPAPQFTLAKLAEPDKTFSPADMKGQVWLLNVWASWCVACQQEHPLLGRNRSREDDPDYRPQLQGQAGRCAQLACQVGRPVRTVGQGPRRPDRYRIRGLRRSRNVRDRQARVIRYKHIGPITPDSWRKKIQPLLQELAKS
jgi:cytochrome c biogenesis protein CcmG, thiol:disulfide interchange protein DsbE